MTAPPATKPVITTSRAVWRGEHRFEAGPEGRTVLVDADAKTAPGPVETLLNALATCSGVDVLDILAKRRTPAERFVVNVTATRRSEAPRRVQRLDLEFHVDGPGIAVEHAERAIALSFEKYCSVAASLAPDIVAETTLILNGERQSAQKRTMWTPDA
ncbi:MAG TPA: OsmC family protein [Gemmatimonadaceae bacterium]|jgi:putative redox protein